MPRAALKHGPPTTPASRKATRKTHSSWRVLPELHVSSTPALHRWPIFSSLLSTLDVRARSIWLRYRLGQLTRYHISWSKLLVVKVTNVYSRRWICSFCKTISFHISTRPRLDCKFVTHCKCMTKCKKVRLLWKLYFIFSNFLLSRYVVPSVQVIEICEYKIVKTCWNKKPCVHLFYFLYFLFCDRVVLPFYFYYDY